MRLVISAEQTEKKKGKGLSIKDNLEIKTGELIAKTEELRESDESLRLANIDVKKKAEELKRAKKDLTETEQELIAANDKLIAANDKLTEANYELLVMNNLVIDVIKDLALANEEKKQLAIKQKEFIDVAAHELRTPAQAILGYSDMILSDSKTNLEYIKIIARNANRIQKLISNILDMAKIDELSLKLNKEQFSLPDLISTVVQDFRDQIKVNKRNLELIYDDDSLDNPDEENGNKDVIIEADRERIAQVLINLVDNAVKNTENGKIIVTISIKNVANKEFKNRNYQSEIIVNVKDSGKGLDPSLFSKVFLKFFIGPENGGGTGLGLYICKAIIEAHDGNLWVENNKEENGATFSFSLPLNT